MSTEWSWFPRYREACAEANTYLASEVDEAEPYKWQYAAAESLAGGRLAVEETTGTESEGEEAETARSCALGLLDCRRGLALLDTDLLPDGEGAVLSGITILNDLPKRTKDAYLSVRLEALNALGALACNRDSYDEAKKHLEAAQALVAEDRVADRGELTADDPLVPDLVGGTDATQRRKSVENQHTLSLFYLAQVMPPRLSLSTHLCQLPVLTRRPSRRCTATRGTSRSRPSTAALRCAGSSLRVTALVLTQPRWCVYFCAHSRFSGRC
jgi:hypothetical protein